MRTTHLLAAILLGATLVGPPIPSLSAQEATARKSYPVPHVLEVTRLAIAEPAPKGLSDAEAKAYAAETAWLITVKTRLEATAIKTGVLAPTDPRVGAASGRRRYAPIEITGEFDALRRTLELEGRKFNTLSNASKVRHDIAMNAIRNLKG